jgi:hypothetical protein
MSPVASLPTESEESEEMTGLVIVGLPARTKPPLDPVSSLKRPASPALVEKIGEYSGSKTAFIEEVAVPHFTFLVVSPFTSVIGNTSL